MHENITYANLGVDEKIYLKFKEICDKKGLKYGKQVEIMMADFIETTIK